MVDWRPVTPSDFEYDFEQDKLAAHRVDFLEAAECFFSDYEVRRNKRHRDRYQLVGTDAGRSPPQDPLSAQAAGRGADHHRMASMRGKTRAMGKKLSEDYIDRIVVAEADEPSAWTKPLRVRKRKATSLSIPASLAERAAFLARLHRESAVEEWLARIIRERIELEESAFAHARRELLARR